MGETDERKNKFISVLANPTFWVTLLGLLASGAVGFNQIKLNSASLTSLPGTVGKLELDISALEAKLESINSTLDSRTLHVDDLDELTEQVVRLRIALAKLETELQLLTRCYQYGNDG